jgi:hypothetical protein
MNCELLELEHPPFRAVRWSRVGELRYRINMGHSS